MATLKITGTAGEVDAASPDQVRAAFVRAARAGLRGEEGIFAIAEREDGAFVQFQGSELEVRVGDVQHRLELGALAAQVAERLRRREDPWGDLPHESLELGRAAAQTGYWRSVWIGTLITVFAFAALTLAAVLYVNWRTGS